MNWRLMFIGLTVMVAVVANVLMLANEEIVPPDVATVAEQKAGDTMYGMLFTVADRESNMRKMGFDDDEVKTILKKIAVYEEKHHTKDKSANQVQVKIESAEDEGELISAFCGSSSSLPVRYSAMPMLLDKKDGVLKVVDLEEISSFKANDWAKSARIPAAYEDADGIDKDRKEDATRMVMAAILANDVSTLLEHTSPWGGGVAFSSWSWASVKKKHPGVDLRLYDYVALMQLVLETAYADGNLCDAT